MPLLFKDYQSLFCLMETINVIHLYFSKTIIVFCLVETIKVICAFTFQRLSEPFVLRRLSRSSSPLLFKDYQSLFSCGDYQCHLPLLFKDYHSLLSCRDNQGHLRLYFSKTIRVFFLVETIKVIYSFTFQRLSESFVLQRLSMSSAPLHFKDFNVFRQD